MGALTNEPPNDGVVFSLEGDLVTAKAVDSGIAASGSTKGEALSRLAEALILHEGGGESIEDEEAFLAELGIEASDVNADSVPPWLT